MQKVNNVLITCDYSFECTAWVEFRVTKYGFSIWAGGEDVPSNSKTRLRVASVKEPYSWRTAARELLALTDGAMYGDYRSDTYINGETGFRADILTICWMREDGISDDTKSFLIGLNEESLILLENYFGSLISDEALNIFERYIEISWWADPFKCWEINLPTNPDFNFEELVDYLELDNELILNLKEKKLLPYKDGLAKIYGLWNEHHAIKAIPYAFKENSYASYIGPRMQNAKRKSQNARLSKNLESFVLTHERLPVDDEVKSIFKKLKE